MAQFVDLEDAIFQKRFYSNGRIAIVAVEKETFEPLAKLTVNIPAYTPLKMDQVLIKSYSENTGVIEDLIVMDLVQKVSHFEYGVFKVYVCTITDKLRNIWK